MARAKELDAAAKGPEQGPLQALLKDPREAAVALRGSIEPSDYKRYVLPITFLRSLSPRYERRRAEIEAMVANRKNDHAFGSPQRPLAHELQPIIGEISRPSPESPTLAALRDTLLPKRLSGELALWEAERAGSEVA